MNPLGGLRREVGKRVLQVGNAKFELHFAIPRTQPVPRGAGMWFGLYDCAGERWYFTLADAPVDAAREARAALTALVSA